MPPLRRKVLKSPLTRQRYLEKSVGFLQKYHLPMTPPLPVVDLALEKELNLQYSSGAHVQTARELFYGLCWFLPAFPTQLPRANLSRKGFARASPQTSPPPVTWESVLLQCFSLLTSSCQFAASMTERADAALGFLLGFDVLSRSSDMTTVLEKEVRAPQMAQSKALRGWTVTFYPSTATQTNKT